MRQSTAATRPSLTNSRRAGNQKRLLAAIAEHGALTRADLTELMKLSRATVAVLVDDLLADGKITERSADSEHRAHLGRGRPATLLTLTSAAGAVAGVTFGHDDIRVAVGTLAGEVLIQRHLRFAVDNSAGAALNKATEEFSSLLSEIDQPFEGVQDIVVGLPAPLDRASGKVMINNILPGWVDVAPARELNHRLARPVTLENDANLAAFGEMKYGAGIGVRDIVFLKASVGIGTGLVLDGRLYRGTTGYAGELGHVQVQPDGPVCRCGSRGCLETQVSIPHIIAALQPTHPSRTLTLPDLVELVEAGDSGASRVVTDAGRTIGRSLADLCNVLNPALLIVGGELGAVGQALTNGISEAINRYAQPIVSRALRVVPGTLAGRAEVLGAIALAIQESTPAPE